MERSFFNVEKGTVPFSTFLLVFTLLVIVVISDNLYRLFLDRVYVYNGVGAINVRREIMPRKSRRKSATGVYHVMVRGINKERIFLHDRDKWMYMKFLCDVKEETETGLHAFCLMNNHVHLLVKENHETGLGDFMKKLSIRYAMWFNGNYNRTGHLFQDRFKSETVESERYYRVVTRYIIQNPVKAKMVTTSRDYQWSSYNEAIKGYCGIQCHLDMEAIKRFWPDSDAYGVYISTLGSELCLEYYESNTEKDLFIVKHIEDCYFDAVNVSDYKARTELIQKIKRETGASSRIISQGLNIGIGIVQRAIAG